MSRWEATRYFYGQCRTDCDPETGAPGYAKRMVDAIASVYHLRRAGTVAPRMTNCIDASMSLLEHLLEQNKEPA